MTNFSFLSTALVALAASCGCSDLDNCPDDRKEAIAIDRPEATDQENLVFESAPWDSLDAFPAKTNLAFTHGLGVTPLWVKAYLSFSAKGTNGTNGGSVTEVAGNQVLYQCMDAHKIVIKNDTCERSFFVKVVAVATPNGDPNDDSCGP